MTVDLAMELWRPDPDPGAGIDELPRAFALVDHGGAAGLTAQLLSLPALFWRSLFEGSRDAGATEVAPILIELGPLDETPGPSAEVLMRWLTSTCSRSNAVLCLQSKMTLQKLSSALQVRIDAQLPGDMLVMLRYFDTRVFEPLMAVLTPSQERDFLGVASKWMWFDRSGQVRCRSSVHQSQDNWPRPLMLTAAQEAALIDIAEPDAVLALMRQCAPDLCAGQEPMKLHELVRRTLPAAKRFGVTDARQQALFCLTEIEAGPTFHAQGSWMHALERAAASDTPFSKVLNQVSAS